MLKKAKPPKLWKHQNKTKRLLKKEPCILDFSDPGTGKTAAQLVSFAERRRKGDGPALVVCPKSLMHAAWYVDARKFVPDMSISLAYSENRAEAFEEDADIYIINTDGVKFLKDKTRGWFKKRFGTEATLIIDESTAFKHRTSQRSKAMLKVSGFFKYRSGLTGTPNSGTITDVWHQAMLIDGGERLGNNFFKFRQATCTPEQVGPSANHIRWVDKPGAEEAVAGLLKDITIRHDFNDCMDIPPNHQYSVQYIPSTKMMRAYSEMEQNAILELQKEDITAVNAAVLRNKLLQIASGAVYGNDSEYHIIDAGRYELILDLVEQVTHSVVFFNWSHQKEELCKETEKRKLPYAVIDGTVPVKVRNALVQRYQAGEFRTIFLHPQTGAHGLTLTQGTRTIWSSPVYQPDFLKQGTHRVYRGGQKHKTETILVEALGTVENLVYERLNDKNSRMVNLLDMINT